MTEEQAKTKWCPLMRVLPSGWVPDPRSGDVHCIGSECMMWRWDRVAGTNLYGQTVAEVTVVSTTDGYCGLAGKP